MKALKERGSVVARILAGAWRPSPPPLDLSREALVAVAPLLLASGAAALAWWRLRGSALAEAAEQAGLRQAYRLHALEAAVHRRRILEAFRTFRSAGLEPVLVKGWAAARRYPEEGLRPYSDLDLHVLGEGAAAAPAITLVCPVDLHCGWGRLDDRPEAELLERSACVALDGVAIRILGSEDHLRLLCLHMLGHGAWRPLWLCDIGVALESLSAGFDWDRLLWGERRRSEWVACALILAHALLGASLEGAPAAVRERRLPRWLAPTVLKAWGFLSPDTPQGSRRPMSDYLRRPAGWLNALRIRWPNPIEATIGLGGPFNEMPRLPFQIGGLLWRAARFAAGLPELLRDRAR